MSKIIKPKKRYILLKAGIILFFIISMIMLTIAIVGNK